MDQPRGETSGAQGAQDGRDFYEVRAAPTMQSMRQGRPFTISNLPGRLLAPLAGNHEHSARQ